MDSTPTSERKRGRPRRQPDVAVSPSGAQRLLTVALEAFATSGFDGASVRHIATRAGVDPSLIAHQFGSKSDLWRAAVDALSDQLLAALGRVRIVAVDGVNQASEALRTAISHLVDLSCDNPLIPKFVISELVRQDERSHYVFAKLIKPVHDLITPLIAAAHHKAISDIDADIAFFAFNGAIATTVASRPFVERMSEKAGGDSYFREQVKRAVMAQLLPATGG